MRKSITVIKSCYFTVPHDGAVAHLDKVQGSLIFVALTAIRKALKEIPVASHSHSAVIHNDIMSVSVIAYYDDSSPLESVPAERVLN